MRKIFISYRRNDSAVFAGRLFDRLAGRYGYNAVFLDIDSIRSASDFRHVIKAQISSCGVFLAIIGKGWAGRTDTGRRIDSPDDPVRTEIEQAIADGKAIIPIYCDDTEILTAAQLPASLYKLAFSNVCIVDTGVDFDNHIIRLRREINSILFPTAIRLATHIATHLVKKNVAGIAAFAALGIMIFLLRAPIGQFLLPESGLRPAVEAADPASFSNGEGGEYQIARGLPDRTALVSETDLVRTIRQAKGTFDIFALTGSAFYNNVESVNDALRKGVVFRVVLFDHSAKNRGNLESHFSTCDDGKSALERSTSSAKQAFEAFVKLRNDTAGSSAGKVEFRCWRGPFLNSFWIRDGRDAKNALAHAEISFHGDMILNPSVRFGKLSPKMSESLQVQFEYIWNKSVPPDTP